MWRSSTTHTRFETNIITRYSLHNTTLSIFEIKIYCMSSNKTIIEEFQNHQQHGSHVYHNIGKQ